jgi:hypothetical protein
VLLLTTATMSQHGPNHALTITIHKYILGELLPHAIYHHVKYTLIVRRHDLEQICNHKMPSKTISKNCATFFVWHCGFLACTWQF